MADQPNFIQKTIDAHLDRLTDRRTQEFIRTHATKPDGSIDRELAYGIDREVHRRASMGRALDIYEPLRWTGISFALSAVLGIGIKLTTEKKFSTPALVTLLVTTALTSAIQLFRLYPRYDAGLKGGLDTALAMQKLDARYEAEGSVPSWQRKVISPVAKTPAEGRT